eukprot:GHVO01048038.1.p1 GENE.GHVO01048038.1~~GHVO01048038.1.p1  ORF type:complete len:115 (-),score=17.31 GHVO01048038.1:139-483(-)
MSFSCITHFMTPNLGTKFKNPMQFDKNFMESGNKNMEKKKYVEHVVTVPGGLLAAGAAAAHWTRSADSYTGAERLEAPDHMNLSDTAAEKGITQALMRLIRRCGKGIDFGRFGF